MPVESSWSSLYLRRSSSLFPTRQCEHCRVSSLQDGFSSSLPIVYHRQSLLGFPVESYSPYWPRLPWVVSLSCRSGVIFVNPLSAMMIVTLPHSLLSPNRPWLLRTVSSPRCSWYAITAYGLPLFTACDVPQASSAPTGDVTLKSLQTVHLLTAHGIPQVVSSRNRSGVVLVISLRQ